MGYIRKIATFSLLALLVTVNATQVSGKQEIEWEAYHNYEYDWSIKYPSDWEIDTSDPESVGFIGKGGITLRVVCEELPFPISAEEYFTFAESGFEEKFREEFPYFSKVSEQKSAIEVVYLAGESPDNPLLKQRIVVTVKDRVGYAVVYTAHTIFYDRANEVYFEPMRQSLKFEVLQKPPLKSIMDIIGGADQAGNGGPDLGSIMDIIVGVTGEGGGGPDLGKVEEELQGIRSELEKINKTLSPRLGWKEIVVTLEEIAKALSVIESKIEQESQV